MKICIHFTCFFNMFILFKNTFRNENITVLINMFYKNSTLNLGGFINVIRRFFYFTCHKWISNAPLQHTSTVIQNSRVASDNAKNIYIQYIMIDILRWIKVIGLDKTIRAKNDVSVSYQEKNGARQTLLILCK